MDKRTIKRHRKVERKMMAIAADVMLRENKILRANLEYADEEIERLQDDQDESPRPAQQDIDIVTKINAEMHQQIEQLRNDNRKLQAEIAARDAASGCSQPISERVEGE